MSEKPLPEVTPLDKPFWDAAARHELLVQRCKNCGRFVWYPRASCPYCGSRELEWTKPRATGTVYAVTIARVVVGNSPAWEKEMPYAVAIVDMDDGFRIYGRVIGVKPEDVKPGMRVRVDFEDIASGVAVPVFRPLE